MVTSEAVAAPQPRWRPSHRARVAALGTGLATAVMVAVSVVPAGAFPGPWHRPPPPPAAAPVDDEAGCAPAPAASSPSTTPTTTPVAAGGTLTQTVTVVVPPMVRVLEDRGGRLTVRSNAGRPPAPGDQVWVRQADGNYLRADDTTASRVLSARWAPGGWCSTTAEHHSLG